jgi:iron complex transport system ATP-binding protein
MLHVEGVTARRGGATLVRDVSLRVSPGELCVIVGPNGAGKSTLLHAIAGDIPAKGAVRLFGQPRAAWAPRSLAQRMAVLPQTPGLSFDFPVRDVVALGRSPHRDADPNRQRALVSAALAQVGLAGFAGRRYLSLSGGEKARTHLARVLAQVWDLGAPAPGGDRLLLLDEPTAALDIGQQVAAMRCAHDFARAGGGVLAVLHDLNLALTYADRLIVMRCGGVAFDGAPMQAAAALRTVFGEGLVLSATDAGLLARPAPPARHNAI